MLSVVEHNSLNPAPSPAFLELDVHGCSPPTPTSLQALPGQRLAVVLHGEFGGGADEAFMMTRVRYRSCCKASLMLVTGHYVTEDVSCRLLLEVLLLPLMFLSCVLLGQMFTVDMTHQDRSSSFRPPAPVRDGNAS